MNTPNHSPRMPQTTKGQFMPSPALIFYPKGLFVEEMKDLDFNNPDIWSPLPVLMFDYI